MANFLNDDIVHQRNKIEEMMMLVAAAAMVWRVFLCVRKRLYVRVCNEIVLSIMWNELAILATTLHSKWSVYFAKLIYISFAKHEQASERTSANEMKMKMK